VAKEWSLEVTESYPEAHPSTMHLCHLLVRKIIQDDRQSSMPIILNFSSRYTCGTLSKAFHISRNSASTDFPRVFHWFVPNMDRIQ